MRTRSANGVPSRIFSQIAARATEFHVSVRIIFRSSLSDCRKSMTSAQKSSISLPISVCRITGLEHIALHLSLPDFKIVRRNDNSGNLPWRIPPSAFLFRYFHFICSSVKSLNWISVSSAFGRNPSFARAERYSKAGCSSTDGVRNANSTSSHSFEMGILPFA